MHELAIAEALVGIAEEHAAGRRVASVHVKVGHLRQVVPQALEFGFELTAMGTVVEGAELTLEEVPARGECRACGAHTHLRQFPLGCERCASLDIEIVSGEELLVESLVVTDEPVTA